jgi:cyclopropane-fatty-acyl-phospholipid synthase
MADIPSRHERSPATTLAPRSSGLIDRIARHFGGSPVAFDMILPDGRRRLFGQGAPKFTLTLRERSAVRALASMDEGRIADAYVEGRLDLDGDMLMPFRLRGGMSDRHPLIAAWRFVQPLLFGQVHTNRQAIAGHYDIDSEFFLSFLDPQFPLYTQGMFQSDDETLAAATERKLGWCFDRLGLRPGDRVLEIGPGWGAWSEYAAARGVKCTGLTISEESLGYLQRRAAKLGHDWTMINCPNTAPSCRSSRRCSSRAAGSSSTAAPAPGSTSCRRSW